MDGEMSLGRYDYIPFQPLATSTQPLSPNPLKNV